MTVYPIVFKKRSGSTLRDYNINVVIGMLKQGMSDRDILTELAMSFCPDTRIDYLNTAKEKLAMDNNNSTDKEDSKSVKEEKPQIQQEIEKERDFTLDLNDFIKSNHYEKLSDSELIEKINTLKNEKLKTNWIKQIKEGSKND